jgi:hypothetical protein
MAFLFHLFFFVFLCFVLLCFIFQHSQCADASAPSHMHVGHCHALPHTAANATAETLRARVKEAEAAAAVKTAEVSELTAQLMVRPHAEDVDALRSEIASLKAGGGAAAAAAGVCVCMCVCVCVCVCV